MRIYPKFAEATAAKSVKCATAAPQTTITAPMPKTRLKAASAARA